MNISEISIGTISTFGSNASLINYLKKALLKKAKSVSLMAYQVSRYVILSNQGLLSLKKILMELPLVGSKQRNQKFP